jgi:glycine/D-amino acid oxidase-like deaminating enzyme
MTAAEPISHGSEWYAQSAVPAPARGRLSIDLDVDVCVIGGGFAGLTTAREVARRGWSVAVVEAGRVAGGASGRSCGFVLPGFAEHPDRIIQRVGMERAKALWALSERGVEYIRKTIRETRMPGVKPVDGWLYVSKMHESTALSAELALLRDEFGANIEAWSTEQVRGAVKSPLYHNGAHFPRAFSIHPLNYALGLAAAVEKSGARIFENTPALSIDAAGIRKRVDTPSARVRALHVVLAGNTGLGRLMPNLAVTLVPITTYVALTERLGDRLAEAITFAGAVTDTERADNHYRVVDGDRLLWAGGMTTWEADPRRFAGRLARDIRRTFPQLGKVAVEHIWSGTLGNAVHKMPQIGEISKGLWLAGGFGGHGFNTTAMAGELIARGIVESDDTWRLFAAYDLVWAGGTLGRAAVQVGYWAERATSLLKAKLVHGQTAKSAASATELAEPPLASLQVVEQGIVVLPADGEPPAEATQARRKLRRKAARKPPTVPKRSVEIGDAAGGTAADGDLVQSADSARSDVT